MQLPLLNNAFKGRLHFCQFLLASDRPCFDPFYPAGCHAECARSYAIYSVYLDWLALSLNGDRLKDRHIKNAAHMLVGVIGNQDPPGRGGLFQSVGNINCVANSSIFPNRTDRAEQGRAGVDADPEAWGVRRVGSQALDLLLHRESRPGRSEHVVLLQRRRVEQRHERVADERRDEPAHVRDQVLASCRDTATQVIITTGGTGITSRDSTFEAGDALLDGALVHFVTDNVPVTPQSVPGDFTNSALSDTGIAFDDPEGPINLPGNLTALTQNISAVAGPAPTQEDITGYIVVVGSVLVGGEKFAEEEKVAIADEGDICSIDVNLPLASEISTGLN